MLFARASDHYVEPFFPYGRRRDEQATRGQGRLVSNDDTEAEGGHVVGSFFAKREKDHPVAYRNMQSLGEEVTKERRRRRYIRRAERRRQKRWHQALAALDNPIILLLEAGSADHVPMSYLPLPKVKERIRDYNLALELARADNLNQPGDFGSNPDATIQLRTPVLIKNTSALDVARFEAVHARGCRAYDCLVKRGELAPHAGSGWSLIYHADLVSALPLINLKWKRKRDRYLVILIRDERRLIVSIRAYSINWCPLFERRIRWPSAAAASVTEAAFPDRQFL